jgi:hypothetical protein
VGCGGAVHSGTGSHTSRVRTHWFRTNIRERDIFYINSGFLICFSAPIIFRLLFILYWLQIFSVYCKFPIGQFRDVTASILYGAWATPSGPNNLDTEVVGRFLADEVEGGPVSARK